VIDLLKQRLRQGKGILVISHNEEIFDALVDEADVYYLRKET
jgi:ABC-type Mn2+/Zn2+ transport system ATPase subunit